MPQNPSDPLEIAIALIQRGANGRKRHYLLSWEGTKVPRSATVGGVPIGWTQHGIVAGVNGACLGY
jgi:hypothetical protein